MKWKEYKLGDIAPFKYGKALKENDRQQGQYKVFSSGGFCGRYNGKLADKGIIVGRKGNAGSVYFSEMPFYAIDTTFYIPKVSKCCDIKYLYYLLKQMHLDNFNSDAAVPGLKRKVAENLKIQLPDLYNQNKVAFILSRYDDLIEINKRRIALLEESARELYKEWFVRMRFPGWEDIKIEKGVPYDWDYKELKQFGKIVTGKTPSTDNQDNFGGDIPFIKTPDMHDCIFLLDTQETLSEKGANSQKKCLLPPLSVCISCIGTVGVVGITTTYSQTNQQINSIIPSNKCYSYYLYFACESLKSTIEMYGANGATMTNLNKSKFGKLKLLCQKDDSLFIRFDQKVSPLMSVILNLQKQNKKLSLQRDRLLPRLMSGQLEV